jgi:hypothetical protein
LVGASENSTTPPGLTCRFAESSRQSSSVFAYQSGCNLVFVVHEGERLLDPRQNFCRGVLTHDAREKAEAEVMGDLLRSNGKKRHLCGADRAKVCRSSIAATAHPSRSCNAGLSRLRRATDGRARVGSTAWTSSACVKHHRALTRTTPAVTCCDLWRVRAGRPCWHIWRPAHLGLG